jgi:enoyl-CoA hydratase/carnithine racemase
MAEEPRVTVEVKDAVADVRLNRPDKLNALDQAMFDALVAAVDKVRGDPSVRAVVLSGEGRGFCAGLDVASFGGGVGGAGAGGGGVGGGGAGVGGGDRPAAPPSRIEDRLDGHITNHFQQAAYGWAELPVPVIAAVHGVALGGGLQVALAADVRFVAPDARLSVLEIRWGLVPDMTGTHTLSRLVPPDVAKELTWTGRMVSGEEAVSLGLATRVSQNPHADAMSFAAQLAASNPHAIQAAKRLLDQAGQTGAAEQFLAESRAMADLMRSPNQLEAVTAYFEKRSAVYVDP